MLKPEWDEYIIKNATLQEYPDDHARAEQWSLGFDTGFDDGVIGFPRLNGCFGSKDYQEGYNEGYDFTLENERGAQHESHR